jgi:hypothetical protein
MWRGACATRAGQQTSTPGKETAYFDLSGETDDWTETAREGERQNDIQISRTEREKATYRDTERERQNRKEKHGVKRTIKRQ